MDIFTAWQSHLDEYQSEGTEKCLDGLVNKMSPFFRRQSEVAELLDNTHVIANTWVWLYEGRLFRAIVRRAMSVGLRRALLEIDSYNASSDIRYEEVLYVSGIIPHDFHTFSNGVSIAGVHQLGKTALSMAGAKLLGINTLGYHCNAVLVRSVCQEKDIRLESPPSLEHYYAKKSDGEMEAVVLALALIKQDGCAMVLKGESIPLHYYFIHEGHGSSFIGDSAKFPVNLERGDFEAADVILSNIRNFCTDQKSRIELAMWQFYRVVTAADQVQKAIHLRVVFDNLFLLEGERDKISSIIKFRATRILPVSKSKIDGIYDSLSVAVHRGELPEKMKTSLSEIAQHASQVIQLYLRAGRYPRWDDD